MKHLRYLYTENGIAFYEFNPSFLHFYHHFMAPYERRLKHLVRDTWDYFRSFNIRNEKRYCAIYLYIGKKAVAYGFILKGGGRYQFCSDKAVVFGIIWVNPEERGNGYAALLLKAMLGHSICENKEIYAYIRHNNLASIKSFLNVGFQYIGEADNQGFLHKIVPVRSDGFFGIYKYDRANNEVLD